MQIAEGPGPGKSALARALASRIGAVVLATDVVKSALLDAEIEWARAGPAAQEVMFASADRLLEQGISVLLDSPSHFRATPSEVWRWPEPGELPVG